MTESLYRKYRPQTFADVVGQDAIERTLRNALAQNKVSHAYLFCGPRGTGKTTTARLMAKAILCDKGVTPDPDGTCESCKLIAEGRHPDVYELDAASRTGVDNVREEIIGRVNFAPTVGRAKIYIIDEVHMLSTAAFNALLKTLEEPPDHVVFILCTTDPNKVPATIHSRCQRFDFHRISVDQIVSRLGAVCVAEDVEFEPEALELIAERSDGGMRNALTSLEQLIVFSEGKVTRQAAEDLLGSLDSSDMAEIVGAIGRRDAAACFLWLAKFVETGADLAQFARDLTEHIRALYVLSLMGQDAPLEVSDGERAQLLRELPYFGSDRLARALMILGDLINELRTSGNARLSFEIALTRLVHPSSDLTLESLAERIEVLEKALAGASRAAADGGVEGAPAAASVQAPQLAEDSGASAHRNPVPQPQQPSGVPATAQPAVRQAPQGQRGVERPAPTGAPAGGAGRPQQSGRPDAAPAGSAAVMDAVARARAAAQAAAAHAKARIQDSQGAPMRPSDAPGGEPAFEENMVAPGTASRPVSPQVPGSNVAPTPGDAYDGRYAEAPGDYAPSEMAESPSGEGFANPRASVQQAQPTAQEPAQTASQPTPAAPAPTGELRETLANAAALQRGWQATMAALKKHKAPFGVLFMNVQVSAKPDQGVIVVTFPATNKFAYSAVRKPEVYSALEEATAQAFGVPVTVQFEQGAKAAGPSAPGGAGMADAPGAPAARPAPAPRPGGAGTGRPDPSPARPAGHPAPPNGEAVAPQPAPRPVSPVGQRPNPASRQTPSAAGRPGSRPVSQPTPRPNPGQAPAPNRPAPAPAPGPNGSAPAPRSHTPASAPGNAVPAASPVPVRPAAPSPGNSGGADSEEDDFASALAAGFGAGISFEEVPDPDNGGA